MITFRSFLAAFDGWCPLCEHPIREGDIYCYVEGKVVHLKCAQDAEEE